MERNFSIFYGPPWGSDNNCNFQTSDTALNYENNSNAQEDRRIQANSIRGINTSILIFFAIRPQLNLFYFYRQNAGHFFLTLKQIFNF